MRNFGGILPNFFRTSEVRKMKENFKMRKCYVTEKMESQQKTVSLQSKFSKDVWSEKMKEKMRKIYVPIFFSEVGKAENGDEKRK